MSIGKILVVLTDSEKNDFLPETLQKELSAITPEIKWLNPDFINEHGWDDALSSIKPEVLVTGWQTPRLPEAPQKYMGSGLKYVCHLPGSVRKLVPRSWIEAGLIVTNWGRSVSHVVAECGLMLMIAGLRRAGYWNSAMHRNGAWKGPDLDTRSLFGKKVGIHGFGAISSCLVRLLEPFDVQVSTYSPAVPDAILNEFGVSRSPSLEALFSENQVIVELASLTPQTEGIVTETLLRSIPDGGLFVNLGRGAVVDEAALARVCSEGNLHAALDVYTVEPLAGDSPLRRLDNVLLLPHIGGPTVDQRRTAGAYGVSNIKRFSRGEAMEAIVNLEIYDRST
ncbi:hydroxyacid dehydrogenase [Rubellicoccus peritrichatus]|uniref:Hydroxyacid dehydrogenase n=1 Tax=Rubellicoccus peritrichatus TaxID=3080537 RepID=A0AAQ3LCU8_9BACT|nr:hydroxyacid dehydrogenase [Puniceicoccus sp. CR14]WOO41218.1 hydroxyacid dehydrogenase [Puniceicoccus sp. CR14]